MSKKIIFAIIAIIALGIGGFFYFTSRRPAAPPEPEIVVEDLGNGEKVVRNVGEGFEVNVPNGWLVSTGVNKETKLMLSKVGEKQPDTPAELIDGVIFKIYTYNRGTNSLADWLAERQISNVNFISSLNAYKKVSQVIDEAPDSFEQMPVPNSAVVTYFFEDKNKIYELECVAVGEKYNEFTEQCEQWIIFSFKK